MPTALCFPPLTGYKHIKHEASLNLHSQKSAGTHYSSSLPPVANSLVACVSMTFHSSAGGGGHLKHSNCWQLRDGPSILVLPPHPIASSIS